MPSNHEPSEDDLPIAEPVDPEDRGGARDDDPDHDGEDREHRVAHRPNPLPGREEEDEEDIAEADILDELDLDLDEVDRKAGRDGRGR